MNTANRRRPGAAVFSGLKLGGVLLLAPSRLAPWLVRAMVAVVS